MAKGDIDITVRDNIVTLKGNKKEEKEVKEGNCYQIKRQFGSFQRSFELPSAIDRNNVKAKFKDGVLNVTLPLAEEAKPKQIKVNIEITRETRERKFLIPCGAQHASLFFLCATLKINYGDAIL